MAGVQFTFNDLKALVQLNIGIAQRLDENRAESFTLLYCDFSNVTYENITKVLATTLRNSDSIVRYDTDYFFILPYTDKYGAEVVQRIFEDHFKCEIPGFMVSYPVDGENSKELLEVLKESVSTFLTKDLDYLKRFFVENDGEAEKE